MRRSECLNESRVFDIEHVQTQTFLCCEYYSTIRMMAEFRKWIEDSKTNQLDKDTEEVIMNLKRHAARRRWKKAKNLISAGRMLNSSSFTSLLASKSQEGKETGRAETPDKTVDASLTADQRLIVQVSASAILVCETP